MLPAIQGQRGRCAARLRRGPSSVASASRPSRPRRRLSRRSLVRVVRLVARLVAARLRRLVAGAVLAVVSVERPCADSASRCVSAAISLSTDSSGTYSSVCVMASPSSTMVSKVPVPAAKFDSFSMAPSLDCSVGRCVGGPLTPLPRLRVRLGRLGEVTLPVSRAVRLICEEVARSAGVGPCGRLASCAAPRSRPAGH